MTYLLLLGLACPGSTPPPSTSPSAPVGETQPAEVTADANGAYQFNMDEPGGVKGAPLGMAFLFPPGADAEAVTGALSDGATGFRFTVPTEGTSVVCTQALPVTGPMHTEGRLKVGAITPGPQQFMGLQLELRARDQAGQLVQPANGRYTTIKVFRDAGEFQEFSANVVPPANSATGEFCFRFVRSTGMVEVDHLRVQPGINTEVATSEAATATDADTPPTCPAGCCPCTDASAAPVTTAPHPPLNKKGPPVFPLPVKWEANEAGGKGGVSKGFEMLPDKAGSSTSASILSGKGFSIKTTSPTDNSVICSDRFSVSGRVIVKGNVSVQDFKPDEKKNSAFVVELRSFGEDGKLVSPAKVRFQRLFAAQTILDWMDFSKEVTPPAAAVASRVCLHFADSTGQASLDWLAVYPG